MKYICLGYYRNDRRRHDLGNSSKFEMQPERGN
jgi:hypothetical protein